MKKITYLTLIILTFILALSFSGCNKNKVPASTKPIATPAPAKEPEKEELLKNCNWTINVDDEITKQVEMWEFKYRLNLRAVKQGGTDSMGRYSGTANFKFTGKATDMPGLDPAIKVMGNVDAEGSDKNVAFNVVEYIELAPLVPPSEEVTVEPLVKPDYLSGGTLNLSGNGSLDILVTGPANGKGGYKDSAQNTVAMPFQMEIAGAGVKITIPSIGEFRGTVVGDPIS